MIIKLIMDAFGQFPITSIVFSVWIILLFVWSRDLPGISPPSE